MDPKSEWALGEFRDAPIELRLLDRGKAGTVAKGFGGAEEAGADQDGRSQGVTGGGRVASSARRVAYQGECLSGVLVVKFDGENGEAFLLQGSGCNRVQRNVVKARFCPFFPSSHSLSYEGTS